MYLSWPVLESLWSLSYLSTKYSKIARVSLESDEPSSNGDNYSGGLPNGEIVVVVVNDGGDTAVGVDLQKIWPLLLLFAEIEVDRLVRQPEFLEDDGDLPVNKIACQRVVEGNEKRGRTCQPLGPPAWVYKVNCFP